MTLWRHFLCNNDVILRHCLLRCCGMVSVDFNHIEWLWPLACCSNRHPIQQIPCYSSPHDSEIWVVCCDNKFGFTSCHYYFCAITERDCICLSGICWNIETNIFSSFSKFFTVPCHVLLPISAISVTDVFMLSARIRFFNTVIPRMSFQMTVLSIQRTQTRMCFLTHRGRGQERLTFSLVLQTLKFVPKWFRMGQHRFTKWFVPTRRQTITWTKFDLASDGRMRHSSWMCHG